MKFTYLILCTLSFLLTSCSMPQLKYINNDSIKIVINNKAVIHGTTEVLYTNTINLSDIYIDQHVLLVENRSIVTYEEVRVRSGYKFNQGINRILAIVFPKYNASLIAREGNLHFYELNSKEEKVYLILENINKRGLKILYGMSKHDFVSIKDAILRHKEITPVPNKKNHQSSTLMHNDYKNDIKSEWSAKNIILDNLVSKIGSIKRVK